MSLINILGNYKYENRNHKFRFFQFLTYNELFKTASWSVVFISVSSQQYIIT